MAKHKITSISLTVGDRMILSKFLMYSSTGCLSKITCLIVKIIQAWGVLVTNNIDCFSVKDQDELQEVLVKSMAAGCKGAIYFAEAVVKCTRLCSWTVSFLFFLFSNLAIETAHLSENKW